MDCKGGLRFPSRIGRRRPAVLAIGMALVAAAALAASAASASSAPARYVYEVCDSALPGGGDAGVSFAVNPGVALSGTDSCNQPSGGLRIDETGSVNATYAFWSVPIWSPPGGTIDSVTVSGATCGGAGTVGFVYSGGWPPSCTGEQRSIYQLGNSSYTSFLIWLGCDGNYKSGCQAGPWVYAHYFAATELDPVAPTLSGLGGSLLSGDVLRGHQDVSVEAHDQGGGVSNVSVSVNGLPAAQPQVSNCAVANVDNTSIKGTVAEQVSPCPTDVNANWTLDTQAYPFHDGVNTVQACASDFATLSNPNTACSATQTVNVDNSCTNSPVGGGDVLSAQFAASNTEEVTVGYGQGAEVTGRLADNAGDPVSGATLCVKAQTAGLDPKPMPVGTVKTDAAGRYSYEVAPGPNRDVVIGYRHDSNQLARDVRYYAHALPILRRSPGKLRNGKRVRLWGTVPGPNAGGRVIVLQARVPGSRRWLTFRNATADAQGQFRSGYRFTHTTRRITYRFRAVVPDQAGYPWVGGNSKPVKVRVLPKRHKRRR